MFEFIPEGIYVAIITGVFGLVTLRITNNNKKLLVTLERQAESQEEQADMQAKIGRYRSDIDKNEREYRRSMDDYSLFLGGAYVRGNDKEIVRKELNEIKKHRSNYFKKNEELSTKIIEIYDEREKRKEKTNVSI